LFVRRQPMVLQAGGMTVGPLWPAGAGFKQLRSV